MSSCLGIISNENVHSVSCNICRSNIGPIEDFFFHCKETSGVQFSLKPTCAPRYYNMDNLPPLRLKVQNLEKPSKFLMKDIFCTSCTKQTKLGCVTILGEGGLEMAVFTYGTLSFRNKNNFVLELQQLKGKWKALKENPKFRNVSLSFDWSSLSRRNTVAIVKHVFDVDTPITTVLSFGQDLHKCLQWEDLLIDQQHVPKDEQLEAYRRGLLQNSICVLPTGFGKTLPASMVMKRMVQLNPRKIAAMIVDRVPLVDQQKDAIERTTGLRCAGLCSDTGHLANKTAVMKGQYQAVVFTAGLFIDLMNNKGFDFDVRMFSVIVFDECHHAIGDHYYCTILKKVQTFPTECQPRVLGLSASPCNASTIDSATKEINNLLALFSDASLYRPYVMAAGDIEYVRTENSSIQQHLNRLLFEELQSLSKEVGESLSNSLDFNINHIGILKGIGRKHQNNRMMKLIVAIELNELLGPYYVKEFLFHKDANISSPPETYLAEMFPVMGSAPLQSQLSNQLLSMEAVLRNQNHDTLRALIFVDTIDATYQLLSRLNLNFSHLNIAIVVGHTVMCNDSQRKVLDDFRYGRCKLIICTSVLEEGLDVQSCNLVLRVGARASLIQLIQSRGRARAAGGKLMVFINSIMEGKVRERVKQQIILDHVLSAEMRRNRSTVPIMDQESNTSVPKDVSALVTAYQEEDTSIKREWEKMAAEPPVNSASFKVLFNLRNSFLTTNCQRNVYASIKKVMASDGTSGGDIRVVIRTTADLDVPLSLFRPLVQTAIVNIPTSQRHFFLSLLAHWDFMVAESELAYIPLSLPASAVESDWEGYYSVDIRSVSSGYLTGGGADLLTFTTTDDSRLCHHLAPLSSLRVKPGESWKLVTEDSCSEYTIEIRGMPTTLGPCSFLSVSGSGSGSEETLEVTLFLVLTSAPSVILTSSTTPEDSERISLSEGSRDPIATARTIYKDVAIKYLSTLAGKPILAVTFDSNSWDTLLKLLRNPCNLGKPTLVTRITTSSLVSFPSMQLFTEVDQPVSVGDDPLLLDVISAFSCLESSSYILALNIDVMQYIFDNVRNAVMDYLSSHDDIPLKTQIKAMNKLLLHVTEGYLFADAKAIYDDLLATVSPTELSLDDELAAAAADDSQYLAHRAYVTPSGITFTPPIAIKSNRVTRMFGQKFRLVYVKFRDEQKQMVYSEAVFHDRFLSMLRNGFSNHGVKYTWLLCSASQLREAMAVFVVGDKEVVNHIRKALIPDYRSLSPLAKRVTRLGLFATADSPLDIGPPTEIQWSYIEDWRTKGGASKSTLLTDGAGRISSLLMQRICDLNRELFPAEQLPSAIQIRRAGDKGVLTVDASLEGHAILMFNSMRKCQSSHSTLTLVKAAGHNTLKLNREILNILFSLSRKDIPGGDWRPYHTVEKLLELALNELCFMLIDNGCAKTALLEHRTAHRLPIRELFRSGLDFNNESFFRSLMELKYTADSKYLRTKTQIPIGEAALLVGVPDVTNTLNDGEVFFYLMKEQGDPIVIISGRVVIFRNPLLDPAAARVVRAIDSVFLRGKYGPNILVLPAKSGVSQRSLAAECSGGDLDGDQFGVIWEPGLVPPDCLVLEPVDFDAIQSMAEERAKETPLPANDDEASYAARTMCNSNLGKIATMHLAICDILPDNARAPLSRQLAAEQSIAVDSPKTGAAPEIAEEAKELVGNKGYPDWMEKKRKASYISEKPLGLLYRRTVSVVSRPAGRPHRQEGAAVAEACYLSPGRCHFLEEAWQEYERYCEEVSRLLVSFAVSSEAEIVLGMAISLPDELSSDKGEAERHMVEAWRRVHSVFRRRFFDASSVLPLDYEGCEDESLLRRDRASAWYVAVYEDTAGGYEEDQRRRLRRKSLNAQFKGFPWIIADVLTELKSYNSLVAPTSSPTIAHSAMYTMIGNSVRKHWNNKMNDLHDAIAGKMAVYRRVRQVILRNTPHPELLEGVYLFGSVSHFLCDGNSDVDIFVQQKQQQQKQCSSSSTSGNASTPITANQSDMVNFLTFEIKPSLDSIATVLLVKADRTVPIIEMEIENQEATAKVDICAQSDGLYKARFIRYFYRFSASHLPLVSCLVDWARGCGVVTIGKHVEESAPLMKNGEFHALILSILLPELSHDCSNGSEFNSSLQDEGEGILENSQQCDVQELGEKLLLFFKKGASLSGTFRYVWPVVGSPVHELTANQVAVFGTRCYHAYHCLCLSRSFANLLEGVTADESKDIEFVYRFPPTLSLSTIHTSFHCLHLSTITKAEVTMRYEGNALVVRGKGTRYQILLLKKEVFDFSRFGKMLGIGLVTHCPSAYFMEGSCFLYKQHTESMNTIINLVPYLSKNFQKSHIRSTRSFIGLRSSPCDSWREAFKTRIISKLFDQIQNIPEDAIDTLTLSIHFGTYYILHADKYFEARASYVSMSEIEMLLNESHHHRLVCERQDYDPTQTKRRIKPMIDVNLMNKTTLNNATNNQSITGTNKNDNEKKHRNKRRKTLEECLDETTMAVDDKFSDCEYKEVDVDDDGEEGEGEEGDKEDNDASINNDDEDDDSDADTTAVIVEGVSTAAVTTTEDKKEKKKRKKNLKISAGFWSGINKDPLQSMEDLNNEAIDTWLTSVFIDKLGYKSIAREYDGDSDWKVEIIGSRSYVVDVRLNDDLSVRSVSERALLWMHGTLLVDHEDMTKSSSNQSNIAAATAATAADVPFNKDLDVRFKLCTSRPLPENSDLRQLACPGGKPPIELDSSGVLTVASHFSARNQVRFARHTISHNTFQFSQRFDAKTLEKIASPSVNRDCDFDSIELTVKAVFAKAKHHEGNKLQSSSLAMDLSLKIDITPLQRYLKREHGCSHSRTSAWLEVALDHILTVSETIRNSLK